MNAINRFVIYENVSVSVRQFSCCFFFSSSSLLHGVVCLLRRAHILLAKMSEWLLPFYFFFLFVAKLNMRNICIPLENAEKLNNETYLVLVLFPLPFMHLCCDIIAILFRLYYAFRPILYCLVNWMSSSSSSLVCTRAADELSMR